MTILILYSYESEVSYRKIFLCLVDIIRKLRGTNIENKDALKILWERGIFLGLGLVPTFNWAGFGEQNFPSGL